MIKNKKSNTGPQKAYAAAKILLGSKGLSKGEMRDILSFVLQSYGSDEERKKVRKLISNEFYYYQGPHHGRDILDMVWDIAEAVENKRKVRIQYERLEGKKTVVRVVKPLGVLFSEYYFYMMAYIDGIEKEKLKSPTIYRIDRIRALEMLEEHFQIPYSEKFQEQELRNAAPLMWGGELKRLKFWYSGPSLEAVLDRLPTAKVLVEEDGKYFLSAEVIGNGAEMWLKGQGERVNMLGYEEK